MFTFITFLVSIWLVAVGLWLRELYKHRKKKQEYKRVVNPPYFHRPEFFGYGMAAFIVSIFLVFVPLVTIGSPSHETVLDDVTYDSYDIELSAMSDSSMNSGSFFIGSGNINETPMYFYYYETDRGMRQGRVSVSDSYVIQEQRDDGKLTVFKSEQDIWHWSPFEVHFGGHTYYEFHVPEGTVVESFNLDLEK